MAVADTSRAADHLARRRDVRKFASHGPGWALTNSLDLIAAAIRGAIVEPDVAARAR